MRAFLVNPPAGAGGALVRDLLYGCWCGGKRVGRIEFPPVPLALLAAVLRREGVPAFVVDAPAERIGAPGIRSRLAPGDLLFLLSSPLSAREDAAFLSSIRRRSGVVTVLAGAYPTFQPREALSGGDVDFILRGEPEIGALELARTLLRGDHPSGSPIPGVGWKRGEEMYAPPEECTRPELDDLPFPDRSLLPDPLRYFNPVVRHARFTTAFSSRGCYGRCTFCSSARFSGHRVRYRSAESVLSEAETVRRAGYREIFFRDELFTGDRRRLHALCDGLPRRAPGLSWVCSTRVDLLDGDSAAAMKGAGCHLVRMGVESGSPAVLERIRKGITVDQTRAAFLACRRAGLDTHAHAMVGLPGETQEDFLGTMDLVREIRPSYLTVSVCTPFPGTALHETLFGGAEEPGRDYLAENRRLGLHSEPVLNHFLTEMTPRQIRENVREAYRGFYFRWEYLRRHLLRPGGARSLARRSLAGLAVLSVAVRRG